MTFPVQVWSRVDARLGSEHVKDGSLEVPTSIEVVGNAIEKIVTVANAANSVIYNADLTGFLYLRVVTDFNTRLLITDTASNTFAVRLRGTGVADSFGIPFQLGADDTSSSQTLNTLQIFNTSGNTAKIKLLVIQ